jgi:phosphonate transport system substrate-binding protein
LKRFFISLTLIALNLFADDIDERKTIRFGIAPFNSASGIVKTHRPLRDYLSEKLDETVTIYTSVNHEKFLSDGIEKRFDMIATPAHFAPFFYEKGYIPLVKYKTPLDFIFVVQKDSSIRKISDLKGKRIGIPDYLSLYYVVGLRWLKERENEIGGAYALVEEPGHAAAIAAVAANKIDAAITGSPPFTFLEANVQSRLSWIELEKIELPSLITMVDKSLGDERIEKIREALETFHATEAGAAFFRSSGYNGYLKATKKDVNAADSFKYDVERALKDKR